MSARKMLRFLLCSVLSSFCSLAVSATYDWTKLTSGPTITPRYPTWQAACEGFNTGWPVIGRTSDSSDFISYCLFQRDGYSNGYYAKSQYNARRNGDSCPAGYTWNSAQAYCKPDNNCLELVGQSFPFSKSGAGADDYVAYSVDGKIGAAQQSGCFNQCVASTSDQKCVFKVSGAYYCKGTAYYTGENCGTGGTSPIEEDQSPEKPLEPKTESTDKPCVFSADGAGSYICSAEKSTDTEGQNCGEVNGVKKCFDKAPTKDATKTDTKVTTTTNPDGSTSTTKTDTATTTKCDGVNKCTTSTTTKTTTTNKDGSGQTTSVTGSCSGPQCPSKNGNPDADGDGFGDCVGDNCAVGGGQDGEGLVSGESCDAPLACAGDAIQCAILRQEKEHRCAQEAFQTVTPEEEQQMRTQLETEFAGEEYQPLTPTEETTFDMSSMLDTSREFSASCPSIPDLSFEMNGGQVSIGISEIINQLCSFFAWMGYVVVAFAMRAAAEIIAKGMS